jgi:transposase-like protein
MDGILIIILLFILLLICAYLYDVKCPYCKTKNIDVVRHDFFKSTYWCQKCKKVFEK